MAEQFRGKESGMRQTRRQAPVERAPEQPTLDQGNVLDLQRTLGNQAIQRLLAEGRLNVGGHPVQAKLTVGAADDEYEQEADQVAHQVMTMPDLVQRAGVPDMDEDEDDEPLVQGKFVQREESLEEDDLVQGKFIQRKDPPQDEEDLLRAKSIAQNVPQVTDDVETQIEGMRGGGQNLPDNTRDFMESRFGQDFSGVQVHTDAASDSLNNTLQARAFTTGSDIFFRSGEYNPDSSGGRELLAHELTHVVQQGGSQAQRKPDEKSPVQREPTTTTVTFGEDDALIVGLSPDAKSDVIDSFYDTFPTKIGNMRSSFQAAIQNFETTMNFPDDAKAEPDFQQVFIDQLLEIGKKGYEKYLEPALGEELPGLGQGVALVTALYKEMEKAKQVAGQLKRRDFINNMRTFFTDAYTAHSDALLAAGPKAKSKAQAAWHSAQTVGEQKAITDPMQKLLSQPTPIVTSFQQEIVAAYIRTQTGDFEKRGFFGSYVILGRIEIKYDENNKFESATVNLQTGSDSGQVADQINKLFPAPIDLRTLRVQLAVGYYRENLVGGKSYRWTILNPPDFTPTGNSSAIADFNKTPFDPLTVAKVS